LAPAGKGGTGPEQAARLRIDAQLEAAGWAVQDFAALNLAAGQGVAVREFPMKTGHGFADYLLFVDGQAVGVFEAKPEGHTLTGVEAQAGKYSTGMPDKVTAPVSPLPFLYQGTGVETRFTNGLDPAPRSRAVFSVHRPETLAEWLVADTLDAWVKATGAHTAADSTRPASLRARLRAMPNLEAPRLYPNQIRAIVNLEHALRHDKPRSLIQMATGSGKTMMAVSSIYRLIKYGGARRVLFLVDRANLAEQAEKEFQGFRSPDDNRKFTELYKVQRLTSNTLASSAKVVITTVQRLYSMLKGEPELDPAQEEGSAFEGGELGFKEPLPVVYNAAHPPETFDVVFVDECHRSIYTLWRQVLEYFDAFLVGLTATPAKHTFGFFHQNLVMEYPHEQAVADGVNVDFEVYRIRTRITEQGSTVEAGDGVQVGFRNRRTRKVRWESPDEDLTYDADALDRKVVAKDQIRTLARAFRDLLPQMFPGRTEIPKTLVFAKDDSHAEDIVEIFREELSLSNEACQKITYRTTGNKPAELIQGFRNSYQPRLAVTVDMIATGTDIRPIEIVMFMRAVKSRVLFEQMKGRGVRVIDPTELKAVTPDARAKDHFAIVDCVGVVDGGLADTQPLEKKKGLSLKSLLDHVAMGGRDPEVLSSLASRLARLDKRCGPAEHARIMEAAGGEAAGGANLRSLSGALIDALDPERNEEEARAKLKLKPSEDPPEAEVDKALKAMLDKAAAPLATNPGLRKVLLDVFIEANQVLDEVSKDEILEAGASDAAREKARALVQSFEAFLKENKDEIDALQFFYSVPYKKRLRFQDIKKLATAIQAPPRSWTPEKLWRAYELLEKDKVRGASAKRLLTDVVSLVRFALHRDEELVPYGEQVRERFQRWLAQQANQGRRFDEQQLRWLEMMRDHIATSLEIEVGDFDYAPFAEEGGLGKAAEVFGKALEPIIRELNEALAA
jgi:type I restriction enzyme R subunit